MNNLYQIAALTMSNFEYLSIFTQ